MKKILLTLLLAPLCAMTVLAQDPIAEPDSVFAQTLDSAVIEDPEWYVAPISLDSLLARRLAPRRAAADACPIDSVQHFNVDSILTGVSVYEYGDTTRTLTWTINPDGSRFGTSRTEEGTNGNITFSASYDWDFEANDWKGTAKEEHTYTGSKETLRTLYTWINGAWTPDTKYTWTYDASLRETEYTTYTRNATTNELVPSQQRIREYNAAGKMTLDIQYTAHNGTDWSAGTKRIYDYDGNNTILNEYYSAYTNGAWVGSSKETWIYTSGKKTNYVKQTWANGEWANSIWEKWEFNTGGKEVLYEKYGVNNNEWAITNQNISGYNEYNNLTLIEKYTFNKTTGVKTGSQKEEYLLKGNTTLQIEKIQYKWVAASSEWVNNIKTVKDYNNANKTIDNCTYNWINNEWVGVSVRTKTTYSGNNVIDVVNMSWSADLKDWVNSTRTETEYTGSNKTKETNSAWQDNAWLFTGRTDYHYTAGKNDTTTKYTSDGVTWTPTERTVNTFNAAGTNIMTHIATWSNDRWTLKSMTRKEIVDHVVDGQRQTLNAEWKCGSDSVWIGVKKDTVLYSTTGKTLYSVSYKGWENNDWKPSSKTEFYYDEQDRKIDEQQYMWNNGWKGTLRNEYGFDEQGRSNMTASYVGWNNATNYWTGSSKTETTFKANGQVDFYVSYKWGGLDWVLNYRNSYNYDGSGNEVEHVVEEYISNNWVNKTKDERAYKNGNQTKNNTYIWLNNEWTFNSRNETYYDDDAQAKLRREIIGSWNNGELQSFADDHYFYDCDYPYYTIRFVNYDGTELASYSLKEGKTPIYKGATPTKPADESTYTFAGWSPAIAPVTGNATYTATFTAVQNSYTITWLNEGGAQLAQTVVEAGAIPAYEGTTPTKQADAHYTYTFAGWTPEPVAATADATYTATFSNTVNKYTITFKNGESVLQSSEVEYGQVPAYNGETPVKQGDAQYTYTFAGWDAELVAVTGEATYNATFTNTVNQYTITFKNGETVLQSTEVAYNEIPAYNGETPVKQGDAQYTYTFAGWDADLAAVTGEATYNATFSNTVNQYTITFKNGETILQSTEVAYGEIPAYNGETPVKQGDAQYTYTFAGWDAEIVAVTGEATYNATFSNTVNQYTITFKNGETVLQSTEVEYGQIPAYNGETPVKQGDAQYTYTFAGWDAELVAVTGAATYNATFDRTVNQYTITFKNGETVLQTSEVAYDEIPAYNGETPTKQGDAQYTYTFAGWDAELASVTGAATYSATFSNTLNKYLITFKNGDETLQSTEVEYGTIPSYTGGTPTKPATAEYTYTFAGWDAELVAVTGEATYNATFSNTVNQYTITFKNGDETLQSTEVEYGQVPTYEGADPTKEATAQYTYTFTGWDAEPVAVTGDATYTATFDSVVNTYTVTFYFEDGVTIMEQQVLPYGEMPSPSMTPSKENDGHYYYHFDGWDPVIAPVTGDAAYTPVFTAEPMQYTITFKNFNDRVLQESNVAYGEMPEYTGATPEKQRDAQYTYVFIGWDPELTTVEGDATYTAVFEAVLNQYTILFLNEDGTELDRQSVDYGAMPEYRGETPTKADDEQYRYVFAGWTPALTEVTKDATYRATYTRHDLHEGIDDVQPPFMEAQKVMIDGTIYILRGGKTYTTDGALVEK